MNVLRRYGRFAALLALVLFSGILNRALAETVPFQLSEAEKRGGWTVLFDGTSTDAWRNYQKDSVSSGWKMVDGTLVRSEKGAGDLITKEKFDSFELLMEYKISPGGNSGLMFHVTEDNNKPWHSGPEIQIQDNVDGHDAQKAGWLYQLYQPRAGRDNKTVDACRPAGEWNQIYLRVTPSDGQVCMNGVQYFNFNMSNDDWKQRVAKSKFSKFENFATAGNGHLCLQDHGNVVAFRNIRVRRIGKDGSVPQPIDGQLGLKSRLAFPKLKWDQWEAIDENGRTRPLRLIELTHANDGSNRLFAVSQFGEIWTFKNQHDVQQSHLLLDLSAKVKSWRSRGANEQGLLGLALHPKFKDNGYFYVYYSDDRAPRSIVSRFSISADDPNKADPNSELVLMEIDQPFQNHNGGSIEFGPDGYLYLGLGDGGFRNDPLAAGQDLSTLLGSILRIDVDHPADGKQYGIPSDNPFVSNSKARKEIFAYGVRNPWRLAFDSKLGDLWIGDVGQELWEEVNVIRKGGNYGWSGREGMNGFGNRPAVPGVGKPIDPIWQFDHRVGRSITGGRVYRSSRIPSLSGKYLYADYVSGVIWALSFDPSSKQATANEQVTPDNVKVLAFGEDGDGEVYYLTESLRGECIYRFDR